MSKYYKITNRKECHHGLQYKTGLNKDILPFNPTGECEPGGIYFSDAKNILHFAGFGPWIREVTLPKNALIYKEDIKWKANKVILGKRRKWGTKSVIQELMENGFDPKANDSEALRKAAEYGHIEAVKALLPFSDPKVYNSEALRRAALMGQIKVVKLLLPLSDPKELESEALKSAVVPGNLELVKLLLPYSNAKANKSSVLKIAYYYGHMNIVKLLVPHSHVKVVKKLGLEKYLPRKIKQKRK